MACCQLESFYQGASGEGLDGGESAGSELFCGEQRCGIGSDILQGLAHFLELEDFLQELDPCLTIGDPKPPENHFF
jgi:hypothetical protein